MMIFNNAFLWLAIFSKQKGGRECCNDKVAKSKFRTQNMINSRLFHSFSRQRSFLRLAAVQQRRCASLHTVIDGRMRSFATFHERLSAEKIIALNRIRAEQKLSKPATLDSLDPTRFKLVCACCGKPNQWANKQSACSSCQFPLDPILDSQEINPNPFKNIIERSDGAVCGEMHSFDVSVQNSYSFMSLPFEKGHNVLFRDDSIVVFEDKYKVSECDGE
jgi:hypothetical protein